MKKKELLDEYYVRRQELDRSIKWYWYDRDVEDKFYKNKAEAYDGWYDDWIHQGKISWKEYQREEDLRYIVGFFERIILEWLE